LTSSSPIVARAAAGDSVAPEASPIRGNHTPVSCPVVRRSGYKCLNTKEIVGSETTWAQQMCGSRKDAQTRPGLTPVAMPCSPGRRARMFTTRLCPAGGFRGELPAVSRIAVTRSRGGSAAGDSAGDRAGSCGNGARETAGRVAEWRTRPLAPAGDTPSTISAFGSAVCAVAGQRQPPIDQVAAGCWSGPGRPRYTPRNTASPPSRSAADPLTATSTTT